MDRKQQIVKLALGFIQSHGYDCFSYRDISHVLGIKKASIHHHFPKKQDLGMAVLDFIENRQQQQARLMDDYDDDAREKLRFYLNAALQTSKNGLHICPISSLTSQLMVIPESMKTYLLALQTNEIQLLTKILEQGKAEKIFRFKGNAKTQAQTMLAAISGAQQMTRLLGNDFLTHTVQQLEMNLTV